MEGLPAGTPVTGLGASTAGQGHPLRAGVARDRRPLARRPMGSVPAERPPSSVSSTAPSTTAPWGSPTASPSASARPARGGWSHHVTVQIAVRGVRTSPRPPAGRSTWPLTTATGSRAESLWECSGLSSSSSPTTAALDAAAPALPARPALRPAQPDARVDQLVSKVARCRPRPRRPAATRERRCRVASWSPRSPSRVGLRSRRARRDCVDRAPGEARGCPACARRGRGSPRGRARSSRRRRRGARRARPSRARRRG